MFTKQETINQVWPKLVASGFAHSTAGGVCLYRGPGGTRCAIGHLIPNDKYRAVFEGKSVSMLSYSERKHLGLTDYDYEFLTELQDCHDYSNNDSELYRDKVLNLIHDHDLQIPTE